MLPLAMALFSCIDKPGWTSVPFLGCQWNAGAKVALDGAKKAYAFSAENWTPGVKYLIRVGKTAGIVAATREVTSASLYAMAEATAWTTGEVETMLVDVDRRLRGYRTQWDQYNAVAARSDPADREAVETKYLRGTYQELLGQGISAVAKIVAGLKQAAGTGTVWAARFEDYLNFGRPLATSGEARVAGVTDDDVFGADDDVFAAADDGCCGTPFGQFGIVPAAAAAPAIALTGTQIAVLGGIAAGCFVAYKVIDEAARPLGLAIYELTAICEQKKKCPPGTSKDVAALLRQQEGGRQRDKPWGMIPWVVGGIALVVLAPMLGPLLGAFGSAGAGWISSRAGRQPALAGAPAGAAARHRTARGAWPTWDEDFAADGDGVDDAGDCGCGCD